MLVGSTGTNPTPFGFVGRQGYQSDPDTGLMLLGHRYYDASMGRFLNRDSAKDGRNWYDYCANAPVKLTDKTGYNPPHGNTANDSLSWLYARFSQDGIFQKWGVSQNPEGRYTGPQLGTDTISKLLQGPRFDMLQMERNLVSNMPGPMNKEPWAGTGEPLNIQNITTLTSTVDGSTAVNQAGNGVLQDLGDEIENGAGEVWNFLMEAGELLQEDGIPPP